MGNPDASNRCDREMPDCRPKGIGRDCWTPKQLAKYGIDPADVAPEECARRLYANFLYEWNDCMSACYTRSYGTQPLDERDRRQLEQKKKKKKNDRDTDGDGTPDTKDDDIDGDGKKNDDDRDPFKDETKDQDKEEETFPDTDPNDGGTLRRRPKRADKEVFDTSTTSWRIVTLCKHYCAQIVKLDYTECFCDLVKCGPEDDELTGEFDRPTFDPTSPTTVDPTKPDDETTPKFQKNKLNVTDSAYGAPIEIVYGRHLVAGNIFWIAPTRREERISVRSLAFGAATTANSATIITTPVIDFAVGLCAPEIDAITRIYFNDYLFYDANAAYARIGTFNNDAHSDSNGQELIKGLLYFYHGGEGQKIAREMLDVGDYPIGYRDLSFIVFRGLDLSASGNRFPSIRIEVASRADTAVVTTTTSPTVAPVRVQALAANKIFVDEAQVGSYKVLTPAGDILYSVSGQSFDASAVWPISDQYVVTKRGAVVESRSIASGAVLSTYAHPIADLIACAEKGFAARARSGPSLMTRYFVMYEAPNVHFHPVVFARGLDGTRTSVDIGHGAYGGLFASYKDLDDKSATESAVFIKYDGNLKLVEFILASTNGGDGFVFNPARPPVETKITGAETLTGSFVATGMAFDATNATVIVAGRVGTKYAVLAINLRTKSLAWARKYDITAPLSPVWNFALGGLTGVFSIVDSTTGYTISTLTGDIIKQAAIVPVGPFYLSASAGSALQVLGTNTMTATNIAGLVAETIPLSDIIFDIAVRSDINPADVAVATDDEVIGYKIDTNSPGKSFLAELSTVFGISIFDDGKRLYASPYSNTAYAIADEDIGETTGARFQIKLRDDASRPSSQTVTYYNSDNGLASTTAMFRPDSAGSVSFGDAASFSTNVVLDSYSGSLLAERLAATISIADNVAELSLGPKHLLLTPGDAVMSASSLFGNASFLARGILVGADFVSKVDLKLYAEAMFEPNPVIPPVIDPPVVDPVTSDDAGMPVIIQAKPATYADVPNSTSGITFYAGVVGNIGETALLFYLNGSYLTRAEVTKPLTLGVVTSSGNAPFPNVFSEQDETEDVLTVVFDGPPDTTNWYQNDALTDVTSAGLDLNLMLVGREWMQYRSYDIAMDGITVTFRGLSRGLRGTDAYLTDTMLGRQVIVYDPAAWGKFEIARANAVLYPATIVSRSLSNEDATPDFAQATIALDATYNWPVDHIRMVRDMSTDFITVSWNVRSRFNGPLDDAWWANVPGITTPCEVFVIKDAVTAEAFKAALVNLYTYGMEWNSTDYIRAWVATDEKQQLFTVGTFTSLGIDYATERFHIVIRLSDDSLNPSPRGHYTVVTFDPAVNNDHVTGKLVEPNTYTVITIA